MNDTEKTTSYREELKQKVIEEALEAFIVNGIKSIRMDDIANSLKMSKRTLYEMFADKETLLKECMLYHRERSQKGLEEIVKESKNALEVILKCYKGSIELYHKTNKKFFEELKKYPKVYAMIMTDRERDNSVVIEFLKGGVAQGIFRDDINFEIIHALLREQMDLLTTSNVSKQFPFLEVYEAIIFMYLRGMATSKGSREIDEFIREYRKEQHQIQMNDTSENKEKI